MVGYLVIAFQRRPLKLISLNLLLNLIALFISSLAVMITKPILNWQILIISRLFARKKNYIGLLNQHIVQI
jgi:hypothetical protein